MTLQPVGKVLHFEKAQAQSGIYKSDNGHSAGRAVLPGHDQAAGSPCPMCRGAGFLRQDLPVGHPDFGRLVPCSCQVARRQTAQQAALSRCVSNWPALMQLCTWEHFRLLVDTQTGKGTLDAFQAAYRYALHVPQMLDFVEQKRIVDLVVAGVRPWLVFYGPPGTGKTHLAAAIGNHLVRQGIFVLFTVVPNLLDSIRHDLLDHDRRDERPHGLLTQIMESPMLILDDLGAEKTTEWASERLYMAIAHRYNNLLPTVITTNVLPENMDPRLVSRLRDTMIGQQVMLHVPDYRSGRGRDLQDVTEATKSQMIAALEQVFHEFIDAFFPCFACTDREETL